MSLVQESELMQKASILPCSINEVGKRPREDEVGLMKIITRLDQVISILI